MATVDDKGEVLKPGTFSGAFKSIVYNKGIVIHGELVQFMKHPAEFLLSLF